MKTGHKLAVLGCLAVVVGSAVCWRWMFRMPLKEFTRYALYMAVMDDEICRNELEGNQIGDVVITFPPKAETLQERYHLFLQTNRAKSRRNTPLNFLHFRGVFLLFMRCMLGKPVRHWL